MFVSHTKAPQPFGPWPVFQFLNLYTVGRTPWTGDQSVAKPLPTHRKTQTQNKRTQTYMSRVGLEPMTPVFERAVIGLGLWQYQKLYIVGLWEKNKLKRTGRKRSWSSQGTIPAFVSRD
jgi:hypothetical protein